MRRLSESEYLYIKSNFVDFICAVRAEKAGSYEDNPAIYDGLTEYVVRNLRRGQNLELYLSDLAFMINNVEGFPAINVIDAIVFLNDNTLFKLNKVLSKIYLVDENKYREMLSQARMFLTPADYLKLFSALSVKNKIVLNKYCGCDCENFSFFHALFFEEKISADFIVFSSCLIIKNYRYEKDFVQCYNSYCCVCYNYVAWC